jgi:hypothetical protein
MVPYSSAEPYGWKALSAGVLVHAAGKSDF